MGVGAGVAVALLILGLVGSGFAALFAAAGGPSSLAPVAPYLLRVLGFALAQAAVSTALSLVLGAALALALARRRFPGRQAVLAALGAAAVMPAIVVVFAIVAVYGRSGWLASLLQMAGWEAEFSLYGWPGILVAHVFLNASLAARVFLNALAAVPAEHWRLAQMLGFQPAQVARHIDVPALKGELAGLAGLIFLLCFTSFAIVLTLGGGGGRATLEVAIYESLRVDLDFGRAAWLALAQIAICLCVAAALGRTVRRAPVAQTVRIATDRPDRGHCLVRGLDAAALALGAALVLPPLASLGAGIPALPRLLDADVGRALVTSLAIAFLSAVLACGMAVALAAGAREGRLIGTGSSGRFRRPKMTGGIVFDLVPSLVLAVPPFALTAGLFLIVRRAVDPAFAGYILLPLMNALGALAFAYRFVAGPMALAGERYGRLSDLLGLRGLRRVAIVEWPRLRRPLAAAFAMSMALSFGDFGIVALFGGELRTLPYLLYERLGAYRLDEASALGLVLVLAAFALAYASVHWSDAEA